MVDTLYKNPIASAQEQQQDVENTDLLQQLQPSQPPLIKSDQLIVPKTRKFMLTKYTIYVTSQRMYIVGSNGRETLFRILEIDMTTTERLTIMEDNIYFSRNQIMDVLNGLEESSEGGLTKKLTAVALIGFIRFTKHYYLCVVTKRRPVAVLGGHYIYHIDGTELIPVAINPKKPDRNSEEARYITTFQNIDLTKTFYYSYNYDITNTLQVNFLRNKVQSLGLNTKDLTNNFEYNERFVWNSSLLRPVFVSFDRVYDWFQPIIHGFIDQAKISILNSEVYLTLIARRSHYFAGARFFKRGANDNGDVANEIETEQIVSDMLTSSFHDPLGGFYNNPRYTSFVQHRGSIPLSWSQQTAPNIRMTKPPIEINLVDPFYASSALHFDDLFKRYGAPIQVLNLIKQREKTARESKLYKEFNDCIEYLNRPLPENKKIDYTAWDMSRASKSRGQDVIHWLEEYSEKTLQSTGFFHNGNKLETTKLQSGVCRTNCIDCLDRTNTAQFVIGKRALGHQLYALGFTKEKYIEYDSDAINILTEMFHDHGDTIALQYGGSHLVNTLQTYRKINQWQSHSRDIIESVKRFYSNSFVDAQRQDAINLFLGNYVYEKGTPMLWDLNTDYYLHNNYQNTKLNYKVSYTHWFTDKYLVNKEEELKSIADKNLTTREKVIRKILIPKIDPYPGFFEYYWSAKYIPSELTSISTLLEMNMNSTDRYNPDVHQQHAESSNLASTSGITVKPSILKNKIHLVEEKEKDIMEAVGSIDVKFSYNSPFKSRKPHREKYATINEPEDVGNAKLEVVSPSEELSQEDLEASYAEIQRHAVQKRKELFELSLHLQHKKIEKFIEENGSLPVLESGEDMLTSEGSFGFGLVEPDHFAKYTGSDGKEDSDSELAILEREYQDDYATTSDDIDEEDTTTDGLSLYETDIPYVSDKNHKIYSQTVDVQSKLVVLDLNKLDDSNDSSFEESDLFSTTVPSLQVKPTDLKIYEKVIRASSAIPSVSPELAEDSDYFAGQNNKRGSLFEQMKIYDESYVDDTKQDIMISGTGNNHDDFYSFSHIPTNEEHGNDRVYSFGVGGLHNQIEFGSPLLQNDDEGDETFDDTVIYNQNS